MRLSLWLLSFLVAVSSESIAEPRRGVASTGPSTILIGQSWLGLWQGGRVVRSRIMSGWQFRSGRLSADGRIIEIAANRNTAAASGDTVLKFDTATLAPRGRSVDHALAALFVRMPIGVDPGFPDDSVQVAHAHDAFANLVKPGERVVRSPGGDVIAVFAPGRQAGDAWIGRASLPGSSRRLVTPGLSIDDGSQRENGATKSVACLLPGGEGVIFTYLGAPADTESEFQAFVSGARPFTLTTPYIVSCLAAHATG